MPNETQHEMRLWLDPIPENLRGQALEALDRRFPLGFLGSADNNYSLKLVYMNMVQLMKLGIYEKALVEAFTATRGNNYHWPIPTLTDLFNQGDRSRLRSGGDPLPHPGPFTLYRGVGGRGPARRVRSFSWTGSPDKAQWFAKRAGMWGFHDPGVYQTTIDDAAVLAYVNDRNEQEFIIMPSSIPAIRRVR